ncbi:MAG: insulinase family protein [Phycisphaerales bacterium]|nr:insulinase family protein [Phycisphaerales bacterium]
MPVTFQHSTLPSGLTIIAEVDPDADSAACGFFVKTGARDEARALMGVSHFLEHMMFKGTADITAEDLNRRFDQMGARNNAYTSGEMTCFYAHVLPERLPAAVELLGRMMRPALREEDFGREKQVILEEIAMYKDEPNWVLSEEAVDRHYRGHPLGYRVLGLPETIQAMTAQQMKDYFEQRYSADNTVVAFAGRLDFAAAVSAVGRWCGSWTPTRAQRQSVRPATGAGPFEMRDAKVSRAYVLGLWPGPGMEDPRRYAAMLLSQVLGASDNSRLHWALIETGLAEEAAAGYDPHDGAGDFFAFAACDPERVDEVWSVIRREISGLVDSITEDDLIRLRNKLATAVTLGAERPSDCMQRIGRYWTYLGRYATLEEELARITAVTRADLAALAAEFPPEPTTIGRLLPAA